MHSLHSTVSLESEEEDGGREEEEDGREEEEEEEEKEEEEEGKKKKRPRRRRMRGWGRVGMYNIKHYHKEFDNTNFSHIYKWSKTFTAIYHYENNVYLSLQKGKKN